MTVTQIDAALAAANPLPERQALRLALECVEVELIEEIVAIPVSQHRREPARRITLRRRSRARHRAIALAVVVLSAVAAAVALLPFGGNSDGAAPAFAASLVRFANASPLALVRLPQWHVVYADEEPDGFGEMHFVRGPADRDGTPRGASPVTDGSLKEKVASLSWQPVTPIERKQILRGHRSVQTGLGVTARRFQLEARSHGWLDISAFFVYQGRYTTFRATVTDMAMFRDELRALTPVSTSTWLRAMPPSVVKSADSGETVRLMLKGIPLPPHFDAAHIRGVRLVHDRYQLGAAVTGTVACMWIADWSHARASGNTAMVKRSIAAMATAPHWPILHQMARQGAWSHVLIGYAKAMGRGTWYGRPLTGDVNSGLGCRGEWGIRV
jgi:hypothetical protein